MIGAAGAVRESAGIGMMPYAGAWQDAALTRLRAQLAPETFAAEWAVGQAYSVDEPVRAAQLELAAYRTPVGSS